MSDDIDIEEHDLLQHPALRSVFPDLARVKQEAVEISDEYTGNGPPKANANDQQNVPTAPDVHEKLHPKDIPPVQQLNSKNTLWCVQSGKQNTTSSNGSINRDLFTTSTSQNQPNEPRRVPKYAVRKISKSTKLKDVVKERKSDILQSQSKSDRTLNLTKTAPEQRCFHAVVMVQDWQRLLGKNKLYCSKCQILFAAKSAIDLHNHRTHKLGEKFLGQHQGQKPQKNVNHSGKAAIKNVNIPTTIPMESTMPVQKCQFCNAISATKEDLIEHLYEHATAGIANEPPTHKCDFCEAKFTRKTFLENHLWSHARSRIASIADADILMSKKTKKTTRVPTRQVTLYKCTACDVHFINKNTLTQHLMYNHTVNKTRIVRCDACDLTFKPHSLFKHKEIHHKQNNYGIDNFKILKLSPESYKASLKKKGYQTVKKIHYASRGNVNTLKNKKNRREVLKRVAPLTNIESETDSIQTQTGPLVSKNKRAKVNCMNMKAPVVTAQTTTRPVTLYKCSACDLHFLNENTQLQHFMYNHTVDKSKIVRCQTCNLTFKPLSLAKHNESHHQQNNYGIEDFNIVERSPENYKASFTKKGYQAAKERHKKSKSYETHTRLRISSRSNIEISKYKRNREVLTRVVPTTDIESETDSIKTSAESVVSKNERTVNLMDIDKPIVTAQDNTLPVTLYKCTACDLHCLTVNTLVKHLMYNHTVDKRKIVRCETCNLTFKPYSLKRHKKTHHEENNYAIEDFSIIELSPENYKTNSKKKGDETGQTVDEQSVHKIHAHSLISSRTNTDISEGGTSSNDQNLTSGSNESLEMLASGAPTQALPINDIVSKDSTQRNRKRPITTSNANPIPMTPNINRLATICSKRQTPDERMLGDGGSLGCLPCHLSFSSVADRIQHFRRRHVIYSCSTCHSQLRGSVKLSVHRRWCTANKSRLSDEGVNNMHRYGCKRCDTTFRSLTSYRLHRLNHLTNTSSSLTSKSQLRLLNKSQVSDEAVPKVIHTSSTSPTPAGTGQSVAPMEPIKTSPQRAVSYRRAVALDIILRCSKCKLHFLASKNMPLGIDHKCSNKLPIGYCDVCNLKFIKRDLPLHFDVHKVCKEVRVMDYEEYCQRGQILHKCEQCGLCCRTLSSLTWHYCNTKKCTKCRECSRDIDNGSNMYLVHRKDHAKLAVTGKDFHIIHYRLIKIISPSPKIKKPRKRGIRTIKRWSRKSNPQGRHMKIIRCNRCKSHMTDSKRVVLYHKNLEDCNMECTICKYCGLSFLYTSIRPHLKAHEQSSKRLRAWDFEVETVSGELVRFDLQDALALLPQCKRCGVIFNSFQSVCRKWNCRDVKTKMCTHCDATFTSGAYVWHFVFHDTQHSPMVSQRRLFERKLSTENKVGVNKLNLTLLRCTKCKLHLQENGIGKHNSKYCFMTKMSVCLHCGLTFSKQSMSLHQRTHRRSRVPLTMTSFTILSTKDLQPVGPEPCPFPACVRCGVVYEGTNGNHQMYADCRNDRIPRLRCPTCNLTFTLVAFPLHTGYYGCTGTPKLLSELPKPKKKKAIEVPNRYKLSSTHELWTQLHRCRDCEAVVDSYEEVVGHIERHRAEAVSPHFPCDACDLKFASASFLRHEELHRLRPGLDGSNFEVLEYCPADFGTRRWILYRHGFTGRRLKYELKQAGFAQFTLYECARCEKYCSSRVAAYQHTMWEWNCRAPSICCATCSLPFEQQSLAAHVAVHSRSPHLAADVFRVFRFFRRMNCPAETGRGDVPTLYKCVKSATYHLTSRQAKHHLLLGHSGLKKTKFCDICNYQFTSKAWTQHQLLHHELNDYKRSDFVIKTIYNMSAKLASKNKKNRMVIRKVVPTVDVKKEIDLFETETVMPVNKGATTDDINVETPIVTAETNTRPVTLYKCIACDLHFLTENTLLQHLMYNHTVDKSKIVSCQTCNLTFRPLSLINHNENHHKKNDYGIDDFNIVELSPENYKDRIKRKGNQTVKKIRKKSIGHEISTNSLFRCTLCRVHYLSMKSLRRHFSNHSTLYPQEISSCPHCDLDFTSCTLSLHIRVHHQENQYQLKDFKIYDSRPLVH